MMREMNPFSAARRASKVPPPAFMQIEGPLVRPLPAEATSTTMRNFWLVQPWVIMSLVMGITLALMFPSLFMDLNRGF
jgi:hypothetical protein